MTGPAGDVPLTQRVTAWMSTWGSVVAPVSVLSGLLFYFGYVSSRAQFEYFGIDVDTVGLDTQHYVMRSPQFLLVPLLVLAVTGTGWLLAHHTLRTRVRLLAAAAEDAGETEGAEGAEGADGSAGARRRVRMLRRVARAGIGAGVAVLLAGTALTFTYALFDEWIWYSLVTPVLITIGAALLTYAWRLAGALGKPSTAAPVRAARLLVLVIIAVGVLWTTATVAQMSGRGIAHDVAEHRDRLPAVILDTKERLYLTIPGVVETALPAADGQAFRYRYRGFRLLVIGGDRMFLVPGLRSPTGSTLVVPFDDSVRVRFPFTE